MGEGARREWVDAWRDAVRASPRAIGLVEIPSTRFLELSPRAAGLLGTTRDAGLEVEYLAIAEPREAAARSAELLASGAVDSVRARRRLRRPDESFVEVAVAGRTIRSVDGAAIGLMELTPIVHALHDDPEREPMLLPALEDLSPRQWEVVSRLARGERVANIASALYLSESTVRNHLSVIFRKVGVHSQQELLTLLRRRE